MKVEEAFLSNFDRDCLNLNILELQAKYPLVSIQELETSKLLITEQMSELNQRRFLGWISKRKWALFSFKKD